MKVRRVDLYPDDFLAGVVGELTVDELGVYTMIILLCYCRGGSVPDDPEWLRSKFHTSRGFRAEYLGKLVERLIAAGKVERVEHELSVRRVRVELERSERRIRVAQECGKSGGRPSNKNNGVEKGSGFPARVSNHQPAISNQQKDARAALKAEFAEWYLAYPHKVAPRAAEQKFEIARRSASQAELLDGLRRYVSTKPQDISWCNPATWLHNRRWEDQPASLLDRVNGHSAGQSGPPPKAINPKILGHGESCMCSNCERWAEQRKEA
jgi:hypothetical protein